MNKIYIYLILVSIVVLSVSQMFLWMDQMQLWQQLNLHLMLSNNPSTPI
jgi:hypothetical protein